MTLNEADLNAICLCAISAANQVGQWISKVAHLRHEVLRKPAGDTLASQIFTEVDIQAQQMILASLAPVSTHFDLGLLAEESPDNQSRFEKDFFWCIDPLDGSLPFTQGKPGYAVSIALVSRAGIAQIGVIYDPREKTLYHAVRGQGLFRNGEVWIPRPAGVSPNFDFTVIADQSFRSHPCYENTLDKLRQVSMHLGAKSLVIQEQDGSVLNACLVLERSPACYFKFPKANLGGGSVWDYAATSCLFFEACATVVDMSDHELNLNPTGSTYLNHCGVLFASDPQIAQVISRQRIGAIGSPTF